MRINKGIMGWISTWLNPDSGIPNSRAHVLSMIPLKKILNVSNGQMQIAITNGTGHFIEVAAVIGVGGVWYGLLSSESELGFELKGDKVIVLFQ